MPTPSPDLAGEPSAHPTTGHVPAAQPVALPRLIARGALAGAAAGMVTGLFSLLLAEPIMDRAVRLEQAGAAAEHSHSHAGPPADHHTEMFSRGEQHFGLIVSTVASAVAFGVLFAVVYALVHRRDLRARPWERSLGLAGAALVGLWLLPFLRYPANPPGTGDPGSLGLRTATWLGAIVISPGTVLLAWRIRERLHTVGAPARQGSVALIVCAGLALLFLLPDNPDAVAVPPELLWDFRLAAAAASVLLWITLGAAFGLLGMRALRPAPARSDALPVPSA